MSELTLEEYKEAIFEDIQKIEEKNLLMKDFLSL